MLEKVRKVLLISDQPSFYEQYRDLAESVGVDVRVETSWNNRYRVGENNVILGSSHLDELNTEYYNKVVLILKEGESPAQFIKMGITRFIFNYKNKYELLVALFREEPVILRSPSKEVEDILRDFAPHFLYGDYDFRFDSDVYLYRGKSLYFCASQKKYLAQWLLAGHKDNSKRMILCNLRKKFGEDFLVDIDRFGQPTTRRTK